MPFSISPGMKSEPITPFNTSFILPSNNQIEKEDFNISNIEIGLDDVSIGSYSTNNFTMLDDDEKHLTVEFFEGFIQLLNGIKGSKLSLI